MNTHENTAPAASENFRELPSRPNVLDDRQVMAIKLLLLGQSTCAVARTLGVTPRTVYTWRHTDTFRRELNRLRRQLWQEACDRLRSLVHPSLDIMEQGIRAAHERSRYRAANAVLRHANLKKCVPLDVPLDDDCEDDLADYD